jgi:hypothetical protein
MKRITLGNWWLLSLIRRFSAAWSMLIPAAIIMLAISALLSTVVEASRQSTEQTEGAGVMTQMSVRKDDGADPWGITQAEMDQISAIPGVTYLVPEDASSIYADDEGMEVIEEGWAGVLRVPNPAKLPPGITADLLAGLDGQWIIPPATLGEVDFSALVGQEIQLSYIEKVDEETGTPAYTKVLVAAVFEGEWAGEIPDTVAGSEQLLIKTLAGQAGVPESDYLRDVGYAQLVVNAASMSEVDGVAQQIRDLGMIVSPVKDQLGELPGIVAYFPSIIALLGVVGVLFSVGFAAVVVSSSVRRRTSEFGLLRIRGWSKAKVRLLVLLDVAVGVLAGSVLGCALGLAAGVFIGTWLLGAEPSFDAGIIPTMGLLCGGLLVVSTLVAYLATLRVLRKDPFLVVMTPA